MERGRDLEAVEADEHMNQSGVGESEVSRGQAVELAVERHLAAARLARRPRPPLHRVGQTAELVALPNDGIDKRRSIEERRAFRRQRFRCQSKRRNRDTRHDESIADECAIAHADRQIWRSPWRYVLPVEMYVNQIECVETRRVDTEAEAGSIIHLVSTLDDDGEIVLWGDLETDRAEVAAQFQLGQRWTLTAG